MTRKRLKSAIIALSILAAAASLGPQPVTRALEHSAMQPVNADESLQPPRLAMGLDVAGKRGLVLFHHEPHEGRRFRPEALPRFLNRPSESSACVQCHHRNNTDDPTRPDTTDVTNRLQFQKCVNCHRSEGDPKNFFDRDDYELSSREAYHRLCVGCHMAERKRLSELGPSNARSLPPVGGAKCHDRSRAYEPVAEAVLPEPAIQQTRPRRVGPDAERAEVFATPVDPTNGYAGRSSIESVPQDKAGEKSMSDRWRIG